MSSSWSMRGVGLLAAILALWGAAASGTRATAAWFSSGRDAESLSRAVQWTPEDATAWRRLGLATGNRRAFERAVRLNSRDWESWIELGLDDERRGNLAEAERKLLLAESYNRRYLPSWTLANFYFRQADHDKFRNWAHQAAQLLYSDPAPLYRLCWLESPDDGGEILERIVPRSHRALADYTGFLLNENHNRSLAPAARALAGMGSAADAPLLAGVAARLFDTGQIPESQSVLEDLHRLGGGPEHFTWQGIAAEGVAFVQEPAGLRLALEGNQPESCDLALRRVALPPARRVRLRVGVEGGADLHWRVESLDGKSIAESREPDWLVAVPPGQKGGRVVLSYRRHTGHPRWQGIVTLSDLSLEVLP